MGEWISKFGNWLSDTYRIKPRDSAARSWSPSRSCLRWLCDPGGAQAGSRRVTWCIPIRAVAATVAALILAGCGNAAAAPRDGTLSQLVVQEVFYDGALVRTEGKVAAFGEGMNRHYWIEDGASNRVALTPNRRVASFLGQEVIVVGTFGFDADRGRQITAARISRRIAGSRSGARPARPATTWRRYG